MPVDWSRYPKDWRAISIRIRAHRAKWKCEWCARPNGREVVTGPAGVWADPDAERWFDCKGQQIPTPDDVLAEPDQLAEGYKLTKIVLTVAHLGTPHPDGTPGDKHDKMDVRDENLAALCQRCHLLYDLDDHIANRKANRRQSKIDGGQLQLFD